MTDAPAAKRPSLPKQIQLFGEYVLDSEIEEGPTWAVYSARNLQHEGERFLVRVLRGINAMRRNVVEGFARQALLLESLKHRGIVPLAAAGVDQGVVFIIKPYITGHTLAHKLAEGVEFEPSELLRIVREAAEVLAYLHRHSPRVVHRALDISKIMLAEPGGEVRMLEVGYAQALDEVARVEPLENLPRPADGFRAPDDVPGTDVDPSVDQFSLAAIARECIAHCGAATSAVEEAARPVLARAMSSTAAARFPDVMAFSHALHDAIVPLTRPGVRIIPGDPNASASPRLARSFVPRPTPSNPRIPLQPIPKPIAQSPAVPPPSVVAARAAEADAAAQPIVAPRPPPAPANSGRKRTAIFGTASVDPEPTEPDGLPVAFAEPESAVDPAPVLPMRPAPSRDADAPSVAPSPVTPTWSAGHVSILDPPVALPPPPAAPAGISDSWTVDAAPSRPPSTAPLATVPLDFDDESRPRATAAAVPAAVAAARASSRPPPRMEVPSDRPRVQTVPPRSTSVAPPPASVRPPARTSAAKSAVFVGVSIVLASAIYTVGFMLRPALMQIAFGSHASATPTAPVVESNSPAHVPTAITATATDLDAATAVTAAADAGVSVAAVPTASPDAATAAIAIAAVDSGTPAATASSGNAGTPVVAEGSSDAGSTMAQTIGPTEPIRPHPGFRERHDVELQTQQRIDQCATHVGRHARMSVTYAGPSGAVTAILWNGTAPDMVPAKPCIEAAVRAFAVHPFTEPEWTTDYVFAVH